MFACTRRQVVWIDLLEPWVDLPGEHADAMHGIVVFEEASLPHNQEVAIATNKFPMVFDLLKYLIGRTCE